MSRALYLFLFLLAVTVPVMPQDPVKVDSEHYKVMVENANVRVLRIHYGPHEKSVMHYHPNSVAIPQTTGRVKFYLPGGKHEEPDMVAGQATWTPAGRHLPENKSDAGNDGNLRGIKETRRKPAAKKPTNAVANANK